MGRWIDAQCRRVGQGMVGNADGWAGGWLPYGDGWAVHGCPVHMGGPRNGEKRRQMGRWKVSKGDGWASARLLQCRRVGRCMVVQRSSVGRGMVSTADGWAGGLLHSVDPRPTHLHCATIHWPIRLLCSPCLGPPISFGQPCTSQPIYTATIHWPIRLLYAPSTGPFVSFAHHSSAHPHQENVILPFLDLFTNRALYVQIWHL